MTLLKILADDKIKRVEYRNISNFIYIDLLCLPEFKQGPWNLNRLNKQKIHRPSSEKSALKILFEFARSRE